MKKILLDLRSFDSKAKIHAYLKDKLDLPSYYGANFDALYDCLTDISEDTCLGVFEPEEDAGCLVFTFEPGPLRQRRSQSPSGGHLQPIRR